MAEGDSQDLDVDPSVRQVVCNGVSMKTDEVEAKLDKGNIQDAESALRDGLSLNSEEARALLGKLEYKRGNIESALRVFEGIELQAAIQRLQQLVGSKKGRSQGQNAANLVIEAVYLKAKSLQKLGNFSEAATECKNMLDAVEKVIPDGASDIVVESKLQEIIGRAAELLPELWKRAGSYPDAVAAYRQSLLNQWLFDHNCCARILKSFAVFLLYNGVEVSPSSSPSNAKDSYVPKSNLEEAILVLMILMRRFYQGKVTWDPSVLEHLTFALSLCSQTSVLAKQLEEFLPGILHRIERWKTMALAYTGAGQNNSALVLLRKALHPYEQPNDVISLLLASKICSEDSSLAAEGVKYGQTVLANLDGPNTHLKAVGLRVLGICLRKQAKVSSSDFERSRLQSEALKSLDGSLALDPQNLDLLFELGIQYAEHRNLDTALRYAKQYLDATGGSMIKGWRLLALVLSAQRRYSEADVVIDAALDETSKWDQGPLLRTKAKLKVAQSQHKDAIETYRYLLALIQAQKKSCGPSGSEPQQREDNDNVTEFDIWLGLATLYSSLSHWKDAEVCLGKARALREYSAETLHIEGLMHEKQGRINEALGAYTNALLMEPRHVPSKILISTLLTKMEEKMLPAARTLLSDALRIEPTNHLAWYHLAMVHKAAGRIGDAMDCFQAASMLQESQPVESFSMIH